MDKNAQADDIVKMLDEFMSSGGGHMNVTVNEKGTNFHQTVRAKECTNSACSVPTLFEGLDADVTDD